MDKKNLPTRGHPPTTHPPHLNLDNP